MPVRSVTRLQGLARLFGGARGAVRGALKRALGRTARTTVFRALSEAGYTTSYSHGGRYYALEGVPQFDDAGLWAHGGALFSKYGTLRETIVRLVQEAPAGQTHAELRDRLRLRVHDTLRELTEAGKIGRVGIERLYVYVSIEEEMARGQLAHRTQLLAQSAAQTPAASPAETPVPAAAPGEIGLAVVVEVLLEIIHGAGAWAAPEALARRLCARGLAVSAEQVEHVLRENGIEKKRDRSRRSPR